LGNTNHKFSRIAVESLDALNNSSAVLMGYDKKLPIAVGSNTKYQEIAFDGFEEYDFFMDQDVCHAPTHLDLEVTSLVTQNESHTGFYSLELPPQEAVITAVEIDCATNAPSLSAVTHHQNRHDYSYRNE